MHSLRDGGAVNLTATQRVRMAKRCMPVALDAKVPAGQRRKWIRRALRIIAGIAGANN